ncbi:MAG: hypothetical protein ACOYZ7_17205 [Chloroflexota bacterium]
MALTRNPKRWLVAASTVTGMLVLLVGCSRNIGDVPQNTPQTSLPSPTPTDAWVAALHNNPYPYLLPLPEPKRTAVDGTYTKVESKDTPPVHCLRCPDYAPEGGVWKLYLDQGVFHIFHQATGWQSVGSFIVTRDRWTSGAPDQMLLFNDPTCPDAIGLYGWRLEDGNLILEVIDDTCAIHLRAMNLTNLPWLSCYPPNIEAGITDHWPKPAGCDP